VENGARQIADEAAIEEREKPVKPPIPDDPGVEPEEKREPNGSAGFRLF
jgi:hypothetical protein